MLAGRVPANVVALVIKAEPGAELACRARSYNFTQGGKPVERGVISYYAAQALPQATTFAAWLQRVEALARADLYEERLPEFYQPSLQILGHATRSLPGEPIKTAAD